MTNTTMLHFGLRESLEIVFRHKRRILWVFAITVAVAVAGAFLQSKVYEASARILVQQSRQQQRMGAALTPETGAIMSERDPLRTEVQIFLSSAVIDGVVEQLGPDVVLDKMRWRWDWLRELPGKATAWIRNLVAGGSPGPSPTPHQLAALKMRAHLEVEPVRDSDVFSVTYSAPDPAFAADVANRLVDIYLDRHLAIRQGVQSSSVFAEEARRLTADLRASEQRLQAYKQSRGIVSLGPQRQLLLQRLSDSEAAIRRAEIDTAETDSRIAEIKRQLGMQSETTAQSVVASPTPMQDQLQRQLADLEMDRAQYTEGSAPARQLDTEIALVRTRLRSESGKSSSSAVSGVNQTYLELRKMLAVEEGKRRGLDSTARLRQQTEQYRKALSTLDGQDLELRELQRETELKDEALRLYLKKQEEARVSGVLDKKRIGNAVPLELAEAPMKPVRPRKLVALLAGLFTGLLGGFAFAWISEFMRRSFATREEAERGLGRPVLAAMPEAGGADSAGVGMVEMRRVTEAVLRIVRTENARTILFASALRGEGKTRLASELAIGLAQQGQEVLIADMRLPVTSLETTTHPPTGASATDRQSALPIRGSSHARVSHLKLADAGGAISAPMAYERLLDQRDSALGAFDVLLLDGPAVGSESEGLWLAGAADAVIVVVEAERTPMLSAAETIRLIEGSGGKLLGVILNRRRFVIPKWVYHWLLTPRSAAAGR